MKNPFQRHRSMGHPFQRHRSMKIYPFQKNRSMVHNKSVSSSHNEAELSSETVKKDQVCTDNEAIEIERTDCSNRQDDNPESSSSAKEEKDEVRDTTTATNHQGQIHHMERRANEPTDSPNRQDDKPQSLSATGEKDEVCDATTGANDQGHIHQTETAAKDTARSNGQDVVSAAQDKDAVNHSTTRGTEESSSLFQSFSSVQGYFDNRDIQQHFETFLNSIKVENNDLQKNFDTFLNTVKVENNDFQQRFETYFRNTVKSENDHFQQKLETFLHSVQENPSLRQSLSNMQGWLESKDIQMLYGCVFNKGNVDAAIISDGSSTPPKLEEAINKTRNVTPDSSAGDTSDDNEPKRQLAILYALKNMVGYDTLSDTMGPTEMRQMMEKVLLDVQDFMNSNDNKADNNAFSSMTTGIEKMLLIQEPRCTFCRQRILWNDRNGMVQSKNKNQEETCYHQACYSYICEQEKSTAMLQQQEEN